MTPSDFRAALDRLGLTLVGAARVVGVDDRTVRRWANGERAVPMKASAASPSTLVA